MSKLIENLKAFNAKERFYLAGRILGNPEFNVDLEFLNDLNRFEIPVPKELCKVFSAMDYHIDWICASLTITKGEKKVFSNKEGHIKGQQEDIDWLIAFEDKGTTHLVFIEAKGVGRWDKKQLESKAKRLCSIFGYEGKKIDNVKPHFVIMSPIKPINMNINENDIPEWMLSNKTFNWIRLEVSGGLLRVVRCDESGEDNSNGTHWKISNR